MLDVGVGEQQVFGMGASAAAMPWLTAHNFPVQPAAGPVVLMTLSRRSPAAATVATAPVLSSLSSSTTTTVNGPR